MDQHHTRHLDLHIIYDPLIHMGRQLSLLARRHKAPGQSYQKSMHYIDHPDIHTAHHQRNHLLLHIIYILAIYMSHQHHIAHYHMTQDHSHQQSHHPIHHTDNHIAQHRLHIDLYNLVRYMSHRLHFMVQYMIQDQSYQTAKHLGHKNRYIVHHH